MKLLIQVIFASVVIVSVAECYQYHFKDVTTNAPAKGQQPRSQWVTF